MKPENSNSISCRIVPFHSALQKQSILLRDEVLRKPLNLSFTEEELNAEGEQIHIVAIHNEQVVGVLLLVPKPNSIIKMRQVAVKPEIQNMGIGAKMLTFSEKIALQKGFLKMELHARETAVPFYLKHQYRVEGDTFMEVGIPHFKMFKNLKHFRK